MIKRLLLLPLLLCPIVVCAVSQNYALSRNITMIDGLLSNTVRHLAQDRYGFIWLGTDNGLCRYDGTQVKTYGNTLLGSNCYISALLVKDDELFIGTPKGLYILNLPNEQLSYFDLVAQDSARLNHEPTSLAVDKDGQLWITSRQQGVFCYLQQTNRLLHYTVPESHNEIENVLVDSHNQLWVVSRNLGHSLMRFDRSNHCFVPIPILTNQSAFCAQALMQTHDDNYWLATWEHGLIALTSQDYHASVWKEDSKRSLYNSNLAHIHAVLEMSPDCILVGGDNGLFSVNPIKKEIAAFPEKIMLNASSFSSIHFVYAILKDHEGGIWYSTFYSGVNYVSPFGARFTSFANQQTVGGLSGNVIGRFCEDSDGNVWIASDDGGLHYFNPITGHFLPYPQREVLSRLNIHALYAEGDVLWIGTYEKGLYRLHRKKGVLQHMTLNTGSDAFRSCYSILRDKQGNYWMGTMRGVVVWNAFDEEPLMIRNFGALTIDIDEDTKGNIWCCTHGQGIWRYTPHTKTWKQYMPTDSEHSLSGAHVNNICMDGSGHIFMATDDGICLYRPETDDFKRIEIAKSIHKVDCIIEDQGILWLTTDKGILKHSMHGDTYLFNRYDGLACEQFMPNAGMKASDGRIYFGTVHGFSCFYPYQLKTNTVSPAVFVTELNFFNRLSATSETHSIGTSVFGKERIDLAYNENMFVLHFTALCYCAPAKNQYAYQLEGFDKQWNDVGSNTTATYTNLPIGTYTFRVKATNNDGLWGNNEKPLVIVIHPPFWWSIPARCVYLLILVGIGYFCIRFGLKRVERKHQREIKELNEKKEVEIRESRLRFFTTIAHEIRTPVSLIIVPLENLLEQLGNYTHPTDFGEYRDTLQVISRNAHRLLSLVNQLLDFNKMQQDTRVNFQLCNINQLVRAVTERFEPTLQQQCVTFALHLPAEELCAIVDEEALTKVISNLMTNAAKYTRTMVSLSLITESEEQFRIEVTDDGLGIKSNEQKKIFNPFYQSAGSKPGAGIGLFIVGNLVHMHHGNVEVRSEVGKGSTFVVTLPTHQQDVSVGAPSEAPSPLQRLMHEDMELDTGYSPQAISDETERPLLLIVEDDYELLQFLAKKLKETYQVITAGNGVEALKQLQQHTVNLIVSDWMMPEMDGDELCRNVRSHSSTSHIPFIMLTAKTDDDSKVQGMDCGADAYIEKPFSVKYLEACIKNRLDMRRLLFKRYSTSPDESIEQITTSFLDNELLVRMQQLIEENIPNTDFNVTVLAHALNISRSGLFAKIKAITDVTPNEMIQVVRLKKAAQLLSENKYRVSEVCYRVGFNNPSYFAKCFQQQFGVTPTKYEEYIHKSRPSLPS